MKRFFSSILVIILSFNLIHAAIDSNSHIFPSDLVYKGAFRLDKALAGSSTGLEYLAGGMSYYPKGDSLGAADGYPGSLFIVGAVNQTRTTQIKIPVPIISPTKNLSDLNIATIMTNFRPLGTYPPHDGEYTLDIEYLPPQGTQTSEKLYFTRGDSYLPTNAQKSFTYSDTDGSNQTIARGIGTDAVHCYNDYLFTIPKSWSDTVAPGFRLGGGRHREGDIGGRGPALFLMKPWDDTGLGNITALPILRYDNAIGGKSLTNYSRGGDLYEDGIWVEIGKRSAFIMVGTKGQTPGYSEGTYGNYCGEQSFHDLAGYRPNMIFYSPHDFAKVFRNQLAANIPQPYDSMKVNPYLINPNTTTCHNNRILSVSYDEIRHNIYVAERNGGNPVIHVWNINVTDTPICSTLIDTIVFNTYDTLTTISTDTTFTNKTDTSFVNSTDTSLVVSVDTSIVTRIDSVLINKTDTSFVNLTDTTLVVRIDTVTVSRTDTSFVNRVDTTYVPRTEFVLKDRIDSIFTIRRDRILVNHTDTTLINKTQIRITPVTIFGIDTALICH